MTLRHDIEPDYVDRKTAVNVVSALLSYVPRATVDSLIEPSRLDKDINPPLCIAKLQRSSEFFRPAIGIFMASEPSKAYVGSRESCLKLVQNNTVSQAKRRREHELYY
jgi:hypothetical protein